MAEHVNAEIASGIVADSETAMDWLKHSFFYIKVTRNPRHYGIAPGKNPDVACGEIVAENLRKISAAHMCESVRMQRRLGVTLFGPSRAA